MSTLKPDKIMKVMSGYMASQCVFTAINMDIFTRLGRGLGISELAELTGMTKYGTEFLMTNLVNEGWVKCGKNGLYRNTRDVEESLTGKYPELDMRDASRFLARMSYPSWQNLGNALRGKNPPRGNLEFTSEEWEVFTRGVGAITRPTARALPRKYNFEKHRRVLDVGGGWGNFLVEILGVYPKLEATLFELPNAAAVARKRFEDHALAPSIQIVEGDFFIDALPTDHDVVLVANVVHHYPPEKNREMLMAIRKSVSPRAILLVVDYLSGVKGINKTIVYRWFGEFLQFSGGEGRGYSQQEVCGLLAETDWKVMQTIRLTSHTSCIVAEAIGV